MLDTVLLAILKIAGTCVLLTAAGYALIGMASSAWENYLKYKYWKR